MMKKLLLFTFVSILFNHQLVLTEISLNDFRQEMLVEHNAKRQLHCTNPLMLDESLNTMAQNYAEQLAAANMLVHSNNPGVGENLFQIPILSPMARLLGRKEMN